VSFISGFTRDAIAPALSPAARARMIRMAPPVDTNRFKPTGTTGTRPTVIAAGRFIRQKGFDTLLAAWSLVLGAWPQDRLAPELVLVGDGPLRDSLAESAARLPRPGCVRFVGPVAHRAMPAIMASGHVFALPVRTRLGGLNPEGLGMVFAEAAACGLAVVAGDSGGTRDTLVEGESGVLVPPDDPHALASVLVELLTDLPRIQAMGVAGRAHVRERFSPDATAAALHRVLDPG
jgi:phosphatidylinositol alpha-1,6-mannosyltransferase